MENNVVSVMLWGEEVGKLYWDERNKRAVFNYHPDFIKKGVEIAPLTARLKADGYEVISGPRITGDGYYESCIAAVEGNLIELTV